MAQLTGPNGYSVGNTDQRDTVQKEILGQVGYDGLGNEYRYIKAGAIITQFAAVKLNGSAAGYDDVREVAAAAQQLVFGVATAAFALADFGWIQTRGVCTCKVAAATAAGSLLVSGTGAAGVLQLATAADFPGRPATANVTGVAAGSSIYLG